MKCLVTLLVCVVLAEGTVRWRDNLYGFPSCNVLTLAWHNTDFKLLKVEFSSFFLPQDPSTEAQVHAWGAEREGDWAALSGSSPQVPAQCLRWWLCLHVHQQLRWCKSHHFNIQSTVQFSWKYTWMDLSFLSAPLSVTQTTLSLRPPTMEPSASGHRPSPSRCCLIPALPTCG